MVRAEILSLSRLGWHQLVGAGLIWLQPIRRYPSTRFYLYTSRWKGKRGIQFETTTLPPACRSVYRRIPRTILVPRPQPRWLLSGTWFDWVRLQQILLFLFFSTAYSTYIFRQRRNYKDFDWDFEQDCFQTFYAKSFRAVRITFLSCSLF